MKELTKEEVSNLKEGKQYIIYNLFADRLSVKPTSKSKVKSYVKENEKEN